VEERDYHFAILGRAAILDDHEIPVADVLVDGSSPEALEQIKTQARVDITLIPYKGGGQQLTDALGGHRTVVWDNTPVNDATMVNELHLGPYLGRDPGLADLVGGVLCNPMNQERASLDTPVDDRSQVQVVAAISGG